MRKLKIYGGAFKKQHANPVFVGLIMRKGGGKNPVARLNKAAAAAR